jgi:hypothetical protein
MITYASKGMLITCRDGLTEVSIMNNICIAYSVVSGETIRAANYHSMNSFLSSVLSSADGDKSRLSCVGWMSSWLASIQSQ